MQAGDIVERIVWNGEFIARPQRPKAKVLNAHGQHDALNPRVYVRFESGTTGWVPVGDLKVIEEAQDG